MADTATEKILFVSLGCDEKSGGLGGNAGTSDGGGLQYH